jgi:hypothetical protein
MPGTVDIWNAALLKIGSTRVNSPDEATINAERCREQWPIVRDAVLRSHPWNCAIHRATLAKTTAPGFGYDCAYQLPTNPYCLRVLQMEELRYDFRVEGRLLLTNYDPCNIIYIKRIVDPNEFDALLVRALVDSLAAELAVAIKGEGRLALDILEALHKIHLPEARGTDGQECGLQTFETTTMLEARL